MTSIVYAITSAELVTVSLETSLAAWSASAAWGRVYSHIEEELLLRVSWPVRDPLASVGEAWDD